ncbi:MAG: peptidoglycan editing factor PgeF [Terriglobales bacterium]
MAAAAQALILRSSLLAELPWLAHGFSTRPGGVTQTYGHNELDLADPDPENRRRFMAALTGDAAGPWQWRGLKQIHSALLWRDPAPGTAGDGLFTSDSGVLLAVRVADCVPILLADAERRAIAAVHAGWRGTVARIVEKAVGELRAHYGSDPRQLRAAIGPSIRRCCYQVGDEVAESFTSQFPYAAELFDQPAPDPVAERYPMLFMTGAPPGHPRDPRWNYGASVCLDLAEANRRQLMAAGVPEKNIEVLPFCTSCRADWFFSHRRDGGRTGRLAAAIGLRP